MITLNREQRDLLLDYYFNCASDEHTEEAKQLLSSHSGAVEFYEKLQHSLSSLGHLHSEQCPEHLAENTIDKLHEYHSKISGQERLEELLDAEQSKIVTTRQSFWRGLSEIAATAAAILIISGVFFPITRNMRDKARRIQCNANLAGIGQSITRYANDHGGVLPSVATAAGEPWWKVGEEGEQNHSNTRHLWLLVKQNYAQPDQFICPGRRCKKAAPLQQEMIARLNDFPSRKYVAYSFRLICDQSGRKLTLQQVSVPIMADANPIFEGCFKNKDSLKRREFESIKLSDKLMRANSRNHRGKGQNVMFSDGKIVFMKNRAIDDLDDIFTIKDRQTYSGVESPASEADIFLVP
jgi:hypothetical protein